MMQKKNPIMALFLVLFFAVTLILNPQTSKADETRSIALTFRYDSEAVAKAEFELYRVGEIDMTGNWKVTIDAKLAAGTGYEDTDIAGLDDETYRSLATVLAGKVAEAQAEPAKTAVTDQEGRAVFDKVEDGLYLICMKPVKKDGGVLSGQPILAIMPTLGSNGLAVYEQELLPKSSFGKTPEPLAVQKVWIDEGHDLERPTFITVKLYADRVLYDTQKLSKENNWFYRWEELDPGKTWTMVEDSQSNHYKVSMVQDGRTVIIENCFDGEEPPHDNPPKPPTPELPITGQLWWPVPVCAVLGMLFFAIGWVKHQKSKDA